MNDSIQKAAEIERIHKPFLKWFLDRSFFLKTLLEFGYTIPHYGPSLNPGNPSSSKDHSL